LIFAIETSCDETSTSIIDLEGKILSHIIKKQEDHKNYGGVVPELASRAHLQILQKIIPESYKEAGVKRGSISAFCATCGPGLIGGLIIGSTIAKSMAIINNKPFYPINHLEGHALSVQINNKVSFPYILLLITGGHTQIYIVKKINKYKLLGTTIDDSVGEAFDKVAKMLGMPYPGGLYVENNALSGKIDSIKLPRPLINSKDLNFSFSGLKTAVKIQMNKKNIISKTFINNLCASFQQAVIDILITKTQKAINYSKERKFGVKNIVIAGGVAANKSINKSFYLLGKINNIKFIAPPIELCGDNAAMIGWACLQRYKLGFKGNINFKPRSRWNLEELI